MQVGATQIDAWSTSTIPSPYRWYCAELRWKKDVSVGVAQLWVNGILVCSGYGNTATYGGATNVQFGLGELYGYAPTIVYGDCARISNTYIGREY
jgi:hypothetical protein